MPELVTPQSTMTLVAILAYLLGSVPFGIVVAQMMGLGNLRDIGSGNIGATNVLRTGNKSAAALTLLFDAGKGGVAVLVARAWAGEDAAQLAGLSAFVGHLFPVWLGFRGGKGVATFLGILLALNFTVGIAACVTWLVFAIATRYSSLAAMMASATSIMWMLFFGYWDAIVLGTILIILIYWKHWPNIMRLKTGKEPKIGRG